MVGESTVVHSREDSFLRALDVPSGFQKELVKNRGELDASSLMLL